jgi:hypothetical protein
MSVVGNWGEAAQFTPQLTVHTPPAAMASPARLSAAVAAADLVITSYGIATRDRERSARSPGTG